MDKKDKRKSHLLLENQFLKSYLVKHVDMQVLLYTNYLKKSAGLTPQILPSFCWDIIKLWSEVGNTTNRDKRDFSWYKKDINTKDSVLVNQHVLRAGICCIDDLYKENGEVIPFEHWVSKGAARHGSIIWMSLISETNQCTR